MTTGQTAASRFPPVPAPDSPFYPALRDLCLSLPGVWLDYPWGETVFKIGKKMFANFGQDEEGNLRVMLKATLEDQAVLTQRPGISVAPYIGKHGWIMALVRDENDLVLVRDLVSTSYELVGPKTRRQKQRER